MDGGSSFIFFLLGGHLQSDWTPDPRPSRRGKHLSCSVLAEQPLHSVVLAIDTTRGDPLAR